jgi:hypothetical protein
MDTTVLWFIYFILAAILSFLGIIIYFLEKMFNKSKLQRVFLYEIWFQLTRFLEGRG